MVYALQRRLVGSYNCDPNWKYFLRIETKMIQRGLLRPFLLRPNKNSLLDLGLSILLSILCNEMNPLGNALLW